MDFFLALAAVTRSLKDNSQSSVFVGMEISEKLEIVYKLLKEKDLIPRVSFERKSDPRALEIIPYSVNYMTFFEIVRRYNCCMAYAATDQLKTRILYERAKYFFQHQLYQEFETDIGRALAMDDLTDHRSEIDKLKKQAICLKEVHNRPYAKFYQNPPNIDEVNPKIPNASSSIKIAIDDVYGKHIVATKDIQPGEVLVVEAPFSALGEPTELLICHQCFQRCFNAIPCDHCLDPLFCSDTCKTTAWNSYHKYMCPLMKSFKTVCKVDAGTLLALKIALENHAEYPNIDNYEGIDVDNEEYSSTSFRVIWSLAGKLEDVPFEKQVLLSCLTAIFYEWLLAHTSFFKDFQATVNKKSFMKGLFTIFIVIGKSLPIRYIDGVKFDRASTGRIGYGLYSIGCIFNHSCCPNVYHTFHGSTVVMRAIQSIKSGEQCCISYSSNYLYYSSSRIERQQELKEDFQFECQCKACVNKWPTFPINHNEIRIKFPHLFVSDLLKGEIGAVEFTLPKLITKLKIFESKEPNKDFVMLQCLLKTCFQIQGNNHCDLHNR